MASSSSPSPSSSSRPYLLLLLILINLSFQDSSLAHGRPLSVLLPQRTGIYIYIYASFSILIVINNNLQVSEFMVPFAGFATTVLATLGVVCKCCDGVATGGGGKEEGEGKGCVAVWSGSCSNLQCLPWKLQ